MYRFQQKSNLQKKSQIPQLKYYNTLFMVRLMILYSRYILSWVNYAGKIAECNLGYIFPKLK